MEVFTIDNQILLHFSHYELSLCIYKNQNYYEGYLFRFSEFPDEKSILKKIDQLLNKSHINYWDSRLDAFDNQYFPYMGSLVNVNKVYKESEQSGNEYKSCIRSVFHFPKFLYSSLPKIRLKKILGEKI